MTRPTARRLFWLAAALLLLAIGWQVAPVGSSPPSASPEHAVHRPPVFDPGAQASALLTYEEIVRGNPLAADRRPPAERYVPPGLRVAAASQPAAAPEAPRLRLYGVATGPTGGVALIDANPAIPGAEIYRLGDLVSTYRLESISESVVVLRGPGGARTLRLDLPTGRSR